MKLRVCSSKMQVIYCGAFSVAPVLYPSVPLTPTHSTSGGARAPHPLPLTVSTHSCHKWLRYLHSESRYEARPSLDDHILLMTSRCQYIAGYQARLVLRHCRTCCTQPDPISCTHDHGSENAFTFKKNHAMFFFVFGVFLHFSNVFINQKTINKCAPKLDDFDNETEADLL